MKEEIILKENLKLLEKEIETITERLERLEKGIQDIKDIEREIKAIKLYLSKKDPAFKKEYPEIIKKLKGL
ncbi:MAG: hypothetical protein N2257_08170 [Thermodesulfovibrionales bacterium]|nr:hypothetical protein [Thermodesulfovibrionales bacterium]